MLLLSQRTVGVNSRRLHPSLLECIFVDSFHRIQKHSVALDKMFSEILGFFSARSVRDFTPHLYFDFALFIKSVRFLYHRWVLSRLVLTGLLLSSLKLTSSNQN